MTSKLLLVVAVFGLIRPALGQDSTKRSGLEIYGFAELDAGYDFNQINPAWSDALRVTKLPTYANQYAPDGNVFFGVRQTRFGVKGYTPTPAGELKAVFEFDMFGVGTDEGQTTIRLRHAYGEVGRILAGQTNSTFMDADVFPNIMEYWGPTGMVFFRNLQIRYAAMTGDNELYISLEKPGVSADQGTLESRIEIDSVKAHYPLPDMSAHFKKSGDWGHVQLAGILRNIQWSDIHTTGVYDLTGNTLGWGLHLSSVLNLTKNDVLRLAFVYGEGVENYMNDCPFDVGIIRNPGNTTKPVDGKALPVYGYVAYFEHNWSPKLSTTIGYSGIHIDNTEFSLPDAYKDGQYATLNLIASPFKNATMAAELEYGKRTNFSDGFSSNIVKLQFSFKYNFSQIFYFNKN
jgi:hypothetical protein